MVSEIVLRMVGNNGPEALRAAIAAPERCAIEPRLRVRGLVRFEGNGLTVRNPAQSPSVGSRATTHSDRIRGR